MHAIVAIMREITDSSWWNVPAKEDECPLSKLMAVLEGITEPTWYSQRVNYFSYPLILMLRSNASSSVTIQRALTCLSHILRSAAPGCIETALLKEYMSVLPAVLNNGRATTAALQSGQGSAVQVSEDTRLAAMDVMDSLLKICEWRGRADSTDSMIRGKVQAIALANPPLLSYVIGSLLSSAEAGRSVSVCRGSLKVIDHWCRSVNHPPTLRKVMPGIMSSVGRLLVKTARIHSKVLAATCSLSEYLICTTLSDASLANIKEDDSSRWLETAVGSLASVLQKFTPHRTHSSPSARISLLRMTSQLLLSCSSLRACSRVLFDILVFFLDDDIEEVRQECVHAFEALATLHDRSILADAMLENFDKILQDIPSTLEFANDEQKVNLLRLAAGYLLILQESSNAVVLSVFGDLTSAFLRSMRLTLRDTRILEERGRNDGNLFEDDAVTESAPVKCFECFYNPLVERGLQRFLRLLSRFSDRTYLWNCFVMHLRTESCREALYCVNECMAGCIAEEGDGLLARFVTAAHVSQDRTQSAVVNVVNDYLALDFANFPTTAEEVKMYISLNDSGLSDGLGGGLLDSLNKIIISTCLILEGIGVAANYLGRDFQYLLMGTLYVIMEKLGDRNQAISSTASAVLVRVGEACGFEDIFKFVFANIDYIANEISRHLRYINQNPKSPNVLIACVRIGKSDILPYINDLVDELFDAIDDVSNPALVELIFRVLDNIMDLAAPPHRLNVEDCIRTPETAAETPTPEIKAFVSWCSKMADVDDEERSAGHHPGTPFKRDHHASADEGTGESASTPREKSVMEKYALKILEKSQHFASSKGAHLRQRMLSLITKALRSLPSQSKELRPIIYSLWPIAIARLDDSEHYVVMEAIHLLDLAICLTRTFLTRYVGKDLLPRLRSLLSRRDLHDVRTHDTSRSAQIVVAVLAAIPNIVLYTHLRPRELKNLGQLVWTFMDKRCPVQVQVLAKQGIAAVERVNPDIVWIGALASSGSSVCGTPEPALGSSFRKVELPTWYREQWTGGMKRIETK